MPRALLCCPALHLPPGKTIPSSLALSQGVSSVGGPVWVSWALRGKRGMGGGLSEMDEGPCRLGVGAGLLLSHRRSPFACVCAVSKVQRTQQEFAARKVWVR